VTNACKVPACGEAVNDGLHTPPRVPGQPGEAEFYPGMV